jgi:hypothetical protein
VTCESRLDVEGRLRPAAPTASPAVLGDRDHEPTSPQSLGERAYVHSVVLLAPEPTVNQDKQGTRIRGAGQARRQKDVDH